MRTLQAGKRQYNVPNWLVYLQFLTACKAPLILRAVAWQRKQTLICKRLFRGQTNSPPRYQINLLTKTYGKGLPYHLLNDHAVYSSVNRQINNKPSEYVLPSKKVRHANSTFDWIPEVRFRTSDSSIYSNICTSILTSDHQVNTHSPEKRASLFTIL